MTLTAMQQFPRRHPRIMVGTVVLLTILSTALFFITMEKGINTLIATGAPWKSFAPGSPRNFHPPEELLVMGIVPRTGTPTIFTSPVVDLLHTLETPLQGLSAPINSSPSLLAPDYLSPGNVDIIVPDRLGTTNHLPFLLALQSDDSSFSSTAIEFTQDDPLLQKVFIAERGNALAYSLPLQKRGHSLQVKQQLEAVAAQSAQQSAGLVFAGLPLAREYFFREMQHWLPILLPAAFTVLSVSTLFFYTPLSAATVLLPSLCLTMLVAAIEALANFSAGIFSLFPPLLGGVMAFAVAATALERAACVEQIRTGPDTSADATSRLLPFAACTTVAALALAPLQSLRLLAIFSVGAILLAFGITALTVPAMLQLSTTAAQKTEDGAGQQLHPQAMRRLLAALGAALSHLHSRMAASPWKYSAPLAVLFFSLAGYGVFATSITETPLGWYTNDHRIPSDDRTFSRHFAGTGRLKLIITAADDSKELAAARHWLTSELQRTFEPTPEILPRLLGDIDIAARQDRPATNAFAKRLRTLWTNQLSAIPAENDIQIDRWSRALDILTRLENEKSIFFHPEMLRYVEKLQSTSSLLQGVSHSLSIADVTRFMHRILFEGDPAYEAIPPTVAGVKQALAAFHQRRPAGTLSRLINPEGTEATITFFLSSPSPTVVRDTCRQIETLLHNANPPVPLQYHWAGTVHDNALWTDQVIRHLPLWAAIGLGASCLLVAFARRSFFFGAVLFGLCSFPLILSYSIGRLVGGEIGATISAAMTVPLPLCFVLITAFLLNSAAMAGMHGHNHSAMTRLAEISQGKLLPLAGVAAAFNLACLFFPSSVLPATGLITTSCICLLTLLLLLFMPPLLMRWQKNLFSREVEYFEGRLARKEQEGELDEIRSATLPPPLTPPKEGLVEQNTTLRELTDL